MNGPQGCDGQHQLFTTAAITPQQMAAVALQQLLHAPIGLLNPVHLGVSRCTECHGDPFTAAAPHGGQIREVGCSGAPSCCRGWCGGS